MKNHLANETSPYLLQHAKNPVNWYPWSEEAFGKAKEEDKPIFLSIGYSTCHWCHVMAHESFENERIADLLNRYFVSIKVDKEERPDIDNIYMTACQAFTGSGGWPTSIFMTPEQKPFFAGTYFPPFSRGRMVGMYQLLTSIHEKWMNDRQLLLRQGEEIVHHLKTIQEEENVFEEGDFRKKILDSAIMLYRRIYDKENGGFGQAPKFPTPHNLLFLLDCYEKRGDSFCKKMAEHTLLQMYRGGLFDHIGFGFSRYSTDEKFLVPHFEKMLYDNALLILAYSKAYTVTKSPIYLEIAEKTAEFILQEMTAPEGGFYSAQDADSEGEEGKFYLFTKKEIVELLGSMDAESVCSCYDITKEGNFEGKNIPNLLKNTDLETSCAPFLKTLRDYRKGRYRLHLDDKILTAWNGWMIAAMCSLYQISKNEVYKTAAEKADKFLQEHLCDADGLYVSYRDSRQGVRGFLNEYASCMYAQLALYAATLEEKYLEQAKVLYLKVEAAGFWDEENGGYYLYGRENETLILRPKETYDGAIPSGNSLMAWNLLRLWQLTDEELYRKRLEKQMDFLCGAASRYPVGNAMFLQTLLEQECPSVKITAVLADEKERKKIPLLAAPDAVVVVRKKPTPEYPLKDGKTTFYVCKGHCCLPPVHDLSEYGEKICK